MSFDVIKARRHAGVRYAVAVVAALALAGTPAVAVAAPKPAPPASSSSGPAQSAVRTKIDSVVVQRAGQKTVDFIASFKLASAGAKAVWDFGDGKTDIQQLDEPDNSGSVTRHEYKRFGSYKVKLTIVETNGKKTSLSQRFELEKRIALASFSSPIYNNWNGDGAQGWVPAEIGGAWQSSGTTYWWERGYGTMDATYDQPISSAFLADSSARDVDVTTRFAMDSPVMGETLFTQHVRKTAAGDYRAEVYLTPNHNVGLRLVKVVGDKRTVLATADNMSTYDASLSLFHYHREFWTWGMDATNLLNVRFEVESRSKATVLTAKLWNAKNKEPRAWTLTAKDNDKALRGSGLIGVSAGLGPDSYSFNSAVTFIVDHLEAEAA